MEKQLPAEKVASCFFLNNDKTAEPMLVLHKTSHAKEDKELFARVYLQHR